jgi:apolipoprotein N-acyltransferase
MAASLDRSRTLLLCVCALLISSALFFFGTSLHPIWLLVWFAPLPVLLIAPRIGALPAFGTAALAWFAGGFNMWHYAGVLHIPLPAILTILGVPSCIFGLLVLLHRALLRRGHLWRAALSFPMLWVTYEYIASITSPHSTFGNIGYTQMNFLPVLQIASITGIWGISFCVFLFPAAASAILTKSAGRRPAGPLALAICGFLGAVISYGSLRLHFTPPAEHHVTVVLMSSDIRGNILAESDADSLRLLRDYSAQIGRLSGQLEGTRADGSALVIVLPEKIGVVSDQATHEMDALFQSSSARANASILVGLDRGAEIRRSNEARLYSPQGTLEAIYDKHHLIPRFESVDLPGTQRIVLSQPSGIWGIEICKDMDFPALSRQYGRDDVGLLLVPAWDFELDGWLHGRMAVLRGVESGLTIARAAKQGLLTLSDDRGRILAQAGSGDAPFSTLIASAPVWHDRTLYSQWGDWFAWLNIAAPIPLLASLFLHRRTAYARRS